VYKYLPKTNIRIRRLNIGFGSFLIRGHGGLPSQGNEFAHVHCILPNIV